MVKFFKTPFANNGDKLNIPEELQEDGSISFDQGYGEDYEKNRKTDPDAKNISRQSFNGLLHDITDAIGDIQRSGVAKWSDEVTYSKGALVWHNKSLYSSLLDSNKSQPPSASWTILLTEESLDLSEYRKKDDLSYEDGRLLTNKEIINDWDQASDENVFSAESIKNNLGNIKSKDVPITGSGNGSGSHHVWGNSEISDGGSVVIGSDALGSSTTAVGLIAVGDGALGKGNNPKLSEAIGMFSQLNSSSERNTSYGSLSLFGLETGKYNTAVGRDAGQNVNSNSNSIFGYRALGGQAYMGFDNVIRVSYKISGHSNTVLGSDSGLHLSGNSLNNLIAGTRSAYNSKRLSSSVVLGASSLQSLGSNASFNNKLVTKNISTTFEFNGSEFVFSGVFDTFVGAVLEVRFNGFTLNNDNKVLKVLSISDDSITCSALLDDDLTSLTFSDFNCNIIYIEKNEDAQTFTSVVTVGSQSADQASRVEYSQVFGTRAALLTKTIVKSSISGFESCGNSNAIFNSTIDGYRAGRVSNNMYDSVVLGVDSVKGKNFQGSVAIGASSFGTTDADSEIIDSVAIGSSSGTGVSGKSTFNTFLGNSAGRFTNISGLTNSTMLGNTANVTGSNQVQLGNANTTTYVYGTVQNRSDKRDKAEISESSLGLGFVLKLKPSEYKWNYREWGGKKKGSRKHFGFIAQDVNEIIDSDEYGIVQDHSKKGGADVLSIGYDEFIPILVKAIQEQQKKIEELEAKLV